MFKIFYHLEIFVGPPLKWGIEPGSWHAPTYHLALRPREMRGLHPMAKVQLAICTFTIIWFESNMIKHFVIGFSLLTVACSKERELKINELMFGPDREIVERFLKTGGKNF